MAEKKTRTSYKRRRGVIKSGGTITYTLQGAAELAAAFRALGEKMEQAVGEMALMGAEVIYDEARMLAPGDGSGVEVELESLKKGKATAVVGPDYDHFYYLFFETGAVAHEINNGKEGILNFLWNGVETFAKFSNHPGMVARPWLRPATDRKEDAAYVVIWQYANKLVDLYMRD